VSKSLYLDEPRPSPADSGERFPGTVEAVPTQRGALHFAAAGRAAVFEPAKIVLGRKIERIHEKRLPGGNRRSQGKTRCLIAKAPPRELPSPNPRWRSRKRDATTTRLRSVKKYIKILVATVIHGLGVFRLEKLFLSASSGFVLAFHRVVREDEISHLLNPQMYVTKRVFRDLLLFLHRHYDVVPLADLAEKIKSKAPRRKPLCALTFDDGYMDNYTNAFPILREMQMPATIFLTAGLVGTKQLLWNDAISIALARMSETARARRHLHHLLSTTGVSMLTPPDSRLAAENFSARILINQLKSWPHARISALLSTLQPYVDWNGPVARRFRLLTWDQVREMKSEGIRFGVHTLHHCILPLEDAQTAWRELQGSKALIESKLGTPVDAIAYPNGAYNGDTIRMARQAGFRLGLTLQKERVSPRSDPMRTGRFLVNQQDIVSPAGRFSVCLLEYEKSTFVLYVKRFLQSVARGRNGKRA